jgi:hypothetical protein
MGANFGFAATSLKSGILLFRCRTSRDLTDRGLWVGRAGAFIYEDRFGFAE